MWVIICTCVCLSKLQPKTKPTAMHHKKTNINTTHRQWYIGRYKKHTEHKKYSWAEKRIQHMHMFNNFSPHIQHTHTNKCVPELTTNTQSVLFQFCHSFSTHQRERIIILSSVVCLYRSSFTVLRINVCTLLTLILRRCVLGAPV